jgi:hypothetical protein
MSSLEKRRAERGSSGGRGGWCPHSADVIGVLSTAIFILAIFLGFLWG